MSWLRGVGLRSHEVAAEKPAGAASSEYGWGSRLWDGAGVRLTGHRGCWQEASGPLHRTA